MLYHLDDSLSQNTPSWGIVSRVGVTLSEGDVPYRLVGEISHVSWLKLLTMTESVSTLPRITINLWVFLTCPIWKFVTCVESEVSGGSS